MTLTGRFAFLRPKRKKLPNCGLSITEEGDTDIRVGVCGQVHSVPCDSDFRGGPLVDVIRFEENAIRGSGRSFWKLSKEICFNLNNH